MLRERSPIVEVMSLSTHVAVDEQQLADAGDLR
jgi:hypothetical protein